MFASFIIVSWILVVLLSLFLVNRVISWWFSWSNLPPGPPYLPFVGHLLFLDHLKPWQTVTNWGRKYGPVFRLYFGNRLIVVLNDFEAIRDAFVRDGDTFSGRPHIWIFETFTGGKYGIVSADGDRWREQRRFTVSLFKDFGVGRASIEIKIQAEIDVMLEQLHLSLERSARENECVNVDVIREIKYTVSNIIFSIMFGWSYERGDPEFERFNSIVDDVMKTIGVVAGVLEYFPFLRFVVPGGLGYTKLRRFDKILREGFYLREIARGKERCDRGAQSDYVAAYLSEMHRKNKESPSSNEEHFFSEKQLENIIGDMFFAGQETTANTLQWGLLFLMYHPEVQKKIYQELSDVIGGPPSWQHRTALPYTCAAIMEIQRLGNIVPFGVLHCTTEDCILRGHFIPKETTILPNLWAVHMDARYFPNPHKFDPTRFLDSEFHEAGDVRQKVDSFIPFSAGKRLCLGEGLARTELFLIVTSLVWNFEFDFPVGLEKPSTDPLLGFTVSPAPYVVGLKKRI